MVAAVVMALWQLARRDDVPTLWLVMSLLVLALFLLPTRIHERYAYPLLLTLLPLAVTQRRWLVAYLLLTFASFYNVYALYTLPGMENPGVHRPTWLEPLFSPVALVIVSLTNIVGFLWLIGQMPLARRFNAALRRRPAFAPADAKSWQAPHRSAVKER
jgi:hypothetical protein